MHSSEDDQFGIEGYIKKIDKYLHGKEKIGNDTQHDFSQPIVRVALEKYLPFLLCLYGLLMLSGVIENMVLIAYIVKQKLYHNETHGFIINLALCHILQCSFVLPITILIIVLQNWIFGQFLCFFVPMLQDIPIHVLVITNLMLSWDRLRWLRNPLKIRLPSFVCGCGTWLTGLIIAIPYPIYTTYIDLGMIFPERYQGVGVCAVNILDDKLDEYMKMLFVVMYFAPSVVLSFIYIRTATALKSPKGLKAELRYTNNGCTKVNCHPDNLSKKRYNNGADIDLKKEQRSQRYLSGISASHFICLCPLMVLRLARMNVPETYENTLHYDLCFLMFVWISLLPTVITPIIFFSWVLSRYNEKIAYLERERSMNIRDTDNDEKCIYDSNKRLSLLPSHFRRESGASNSSIRFLISNNNSPVLRQHINPSKNSIDNDLIEECFIENSSPNVENK
ncbi:unnamed protein product [Diamesa tonsa]